MTFRTLRRTLLVAFGVAVLTSAGQLGLGYGLGILRFGHTFDDASVDHWHAQLAWLVWFAMAAAVIGAAVVSRTTRWRPVGPTAESDPPGDPVPASDIDQAAGNETAEDRLGTDPVSVGPPDGDPAAPEHPLTVRTPGQPGGVPGGVGVRVAIAASAALGGAAVAPLSLVPAQAARLPSGDPVLIAGVSATLGAAVGLFAALAVLGPRPVRWNLAAVFGAGWLLALVSVAPSLGSRDPMPTVRLGVFDPAWLSTGLNQRLAIATMPALALVIGAATGGLARWRGYRLPVVAPCGVAGAALLSLAYLVAGPGGGADRYQAAPYWGALAAAATGLLGSLLAATIRWPVFAGRPTPPEGADGDTSVPGTATTPESGTATQADATAHAIAVESPDRTTGEPITGGPITGEPVRPSDGEGGEEPGGAAQSGAGRFSPSTAPSSRRPTTEDFWPVPPPDGSPAPAGPDRTPAAPSGRPVPVLGPPTGVPAPAAVRQHPAPDRNGDGERGDRSARPVEDEREADPTASSGTEAATSEIDAPAVRTGRSWRRLFRRSDPAPAGGDPAAPAVAAAETPADTDPPQVLAAPAAAVVTAATPVTPATPSRPAGALGGVTEKEATGEQATGGTEPAEETSPPASDTTTGAGPGRVPAGKGRTSSGKARTSAGGGRTATGRAGTTSTGNGPSDEPGDDSPTVPVPRPRERRKRNRSEPELPAGDAEYVDWVSGLRGRGPRTADPPRAGGSASSPPSSGGRPAE